MKDRLKFWLLTYNDLLYNLKKYNFHHTLFSGVKEQRNYFILKTKKSPFHISIFKDQWEYYHVFAKEEARLFHLTHEQTKCSIYFVLDTEMKIREPNNFLYEQPTFGFSSSTRKKCDEHLLKDILSEFDKIIKVISKKLYIDFKKRLEQ
jgi:hypothetical protein